MIQIGEVRGAVFDVDDTLLDNKPGKLGHGLHEKSRLAAFRFVGERHGIPELADITLEDNVRAFLESPVHSLPGAVWNYLWKSGLVDSPTINPENPLLQEVVAKKNELHAVVLRDEAEEVPGASAFVRQLGRCGLQDRLAIASSAFRRDIDVFLAKVGLQDLFPDGRIKSLESAAHTKPHPELFNLAFASLGLPESARSHVLAFEDDPRGIMAAKAAGLYTCAITTRHDRQDLQGLEVAPDPIAWRRGPVTGRVRRVVTSHSAILPDMRKIILASQSPRRKELLTAMGVADFQTVPSDFDEQLDDARTPEEVAMELGLGKAMAVARRYPEALVIGSDTIVTVDGRQLAKAETIDHARQMLHDASLNPAQITSSLAVVCLVDGFEFVQAENAWAYFRPYDEQAVERYLATGDYADKAGGWGIQSGAGPLIDHVSGNTDTIVGLPTHLLAPVLRSLGYRAEPVDYRLSPDIKILNPA